MSKAGPTEYLVVELTQNEEENTFILSLPPEDIVKSSWNLIVEHSFPRVCLSNLDDTQRRQLVEEGQHQFIESVLKTRVSPNLHLVALPRSLYELGALVLHAFDRISTPFDILSSGASEMNVIEPFHFDHKTTVNRVSISLLLGQVRASLAKESLVETAASLNHFFFACLSRLQSTAPDFASILDLELDIVSIRMTNKPLHRIPTEQCVKLANLFLNDLCTVQIDAETDISRQYDSWPLSSPYLLSMLDETEREDHERLLLILKELQSDLDALHVSISASQQSCPQELSNQVEYPLTLSVLDMVEALPDAEKATTLNSRARSDPNSILRYIQQKSVEPNNFVYAKMCMAFCQEVVQLDCVPKRFSELKRLSALLDIVRRTDPFIAIARRVGFWEPRKLIMDVIEAENAERTRDAIFLFRGSKDLKHESLTTATHSLSPLEYGLELGSSTDYMQIGETNPCLAHSMSFGSSLFAGLLFDPTAAVWTYWSSKSISYGFYIEFPIDKHLLSRLVSDYQGSISTPSVDSDWWFLPPIPPLMALAGSGELWHARTKCKIPLEHREDAFHFVSGILSCSYRRVPDFLLATSSSPPVFSSLPIHIVKNPA